MANNNRQRITLLQNQLREIENRFTVLYEQINTFEKQYGNIQTYHTESSNLKLNIENLKNEGTNILGEIQTLNTSSNELSDQISELVQSAQKSKTIFDNEATRLQKVNEKLEEFEEKIIEQLNIAASGALALAFEARYSQVDIELDRWRKNLYRATATLIGVGILFFIYSFWAELNYQLLLKISVSFPIVYAVWFSGKQYETERKIAEQYAFKAAKSKSLAAFSKTVKEIDDSNRENNIEGGKQRTQKFVIEAINKIYNEPNIQIKKNEFPLEKILKTAKELTTLK